VHFQKIKASGGINFKEKCTLPERDKWIRFLLWKGYKKAGTTSGLFYSDFIY